MKRHLSLDEKLAALQEADTFRKWYSLDDRRACVLCDQIISGRMIDVWEEKRGIFRLRCPTPGCKGGPRDWFYHGTNGRPAGKVVQSKAPGRFLSSLRAGTLPAA